MSGYDFHPEAFTDIDEIAIYIGEDSPEAAHRVVDEIHSAIQQLVPFPHSWTPPLRPQRSPFTFLFACVIMLLPMRRTKSRFGSLPSCTATAAPGSCSNFKRTRGRNHLQ
jgi:plasmid stabilization system protein ParE